MSLKVLALRVWRDLGLSRIPGMRKLRQALIPNTRGWDNADKILKGATMNTQQSAGLKTVHSTNVTVLNPKKPATPANTDKPKSSNPKYKSYEDPRILARVSYWSGKLIHISEQALAEKVSENAILIRNLDAPTKNEKHIYNRILQNTKFIAFRKRHLGVVDLISRQTDSSTSLKSVDDMTRMIERFVSKSKFRLLQYGFLIAVNPQNVFPIALQQSSYVSKLICLYTLDFKGSVDRACIENADRIICPTDLASSVKNHAVAGLTLYDNPLHMENLLTAAIQSFFPKEFNMLLPIWQAYEQIGNIENISLRKRDLVLKLNCTEKAAPVVSGTFSEYIEAIAERTTAVLASEAVCQQYVSWIESLESKSTRIAFLKRAFKDGVRCEMIYA